jgi:BirA family transcriptional regulator, biotin operon repressor / biotin---[acetyl-CoA-carboxylase] ligase
MTGDIRIKLETVTSTQSYLSNLLSQKKLTEGTLVIANEQTQGRGMARNTWLSDYGENLLFSFVWYPDFLPVVRQFEMSKAISLAIYDFVKFVFIDQAISIKWPNDLFIGDKKVAGMLVENSICNNQFVYSLVGIGLNVNQIVFSPELPNPVSIKNLRGTDFDLTECLNSLCGCLDIRYEQLKNKTTQIDKDYRDALYRIGVLSGFNYQGKMIKAKITGVAEYGYLQLENANGRKLECDLKEISFIL